MMFPNMPLTGAEGFPRGAPSMAPIEDPLGAYTLSDAPASARSTIRRGFVECDMVLDERIVGRKIQTGEHESRRLNTSRIPSLKARTHALRKAITVLMSARFQDAFDANKKGEGLLQLVTC